MSEPPPSTPWAVEAEALLSELTPRQHEGLDAGDVARQRIRFGRNDLKKVGKRPVALILVAQFRSLIVALLSAAAIVSFLFGNLIEGCAVVAVVLINAMIGFATELKAVRSMEALRKLTLVEVTVRRGGTLRRIPANEVVVGDVVVVEGGDIVAADMRLFEASRLRADESSLTGESVPVTKEVAPIPAETILAERGNMLFKGTAVTRGSGEGVVTAVGTGTELGKISSLVADAEEGSTPLEKRLDQLAHRLVWVTLAVAATTAVAGIRAGKEVYLMIETSIALAVAAIPEGLPIVATIALARGMWRMARRNALINRLSAVETLGATQVICTDKTGTLTENQMTAVKLVTRSGREVDLEPRPPSSDREVVDALLTAAHCNNASLDGVGDPLEIALLEAAAAAGIEAPLQKRVGEEAFDSESKMMATIHRGGRGFVYHVKGAAEPLVAACSDLDAPGKAAWLQTNESLASRGFRVLALAAKGSTRPDDPPYDDLEFLGLVAMVDPPREDVRDAIAKCRSAGIEVVMITGDQPATAAYVADAVGLKAGMKSSEVIPGTEVRAADELGDEERRAVCSVPVFARVSPAQKLELIETHQRENRVVAMTGDGVNDAPALKKADIGIAMGVRGTEVAKEASDVVLKDDAFGTIVEAVGQGRAIFANIRRFVVYLMSCNLSEILIVGMASAANAPLPILPLQILFLNMVTDVFPALALGMGKGADNLMELPPRDAREHVLRRRDWLKIVGFSLLITVSVLTVFGISLSGSDGDAGEAVSVAFLTLAGAQLVHVFNMRSNSEGILVNQITRNRYVWVSLGICLALLALAILYPPLAGVLGLRNPSGFGWILIASGTITPLLVGQVAAQLIRRPKVDGDR